MRSFSRWSWRALTLVALACSPARTPQRTGAAAASAPPAASAPVVAAPTNDAASANPDGEPCGPLACLSFDSPEKAFARVLAEQPLILAIGEAHAQKGTEGIASVTRRFTEQLLPMLQGKASDLVLELWIASGQCGKREKQVAQQQKEVTVTQAETNQNEFVALGKTSKAFGIEPRVLRPTCADYERIAAAGAGDIATMLEMIARLSGDELESLFLERKTATTGRMLLAYGGALHNDIAPRPERQTWSFGPRMSDLTASRYVELDLVVPEFIGDGPAWKALPWVLHYDRTRHGRRVILFHPAPRSYVLIFAAREASVH